MRHQLNCCISSSMQHFSQFVRRRTDGQNKKNAGMQAGVGIILQKDQLFFRRIRCLALKLRTHERRKKSRMSSRTVHSARMPPFVVQAAYRTFLKTPAFAGGLERAPKIHGQTRNWPAFCTVVVHAYSQLSAPPVWYSMTRVSKKLRSFFRSIISLIHGKGFSSCGNNASRPICCARRFAMKRR